MASALMKLRLEVGARVVPYLPRFLRLKLVSERTAWSAKDLRQIARAGRSEIRCLIAPANFAAQGYLWARAVETLPGVTCTNMQIESRASGFRFPADMKVPYNVVWSSHLWSRRQTKEITKNFTHVLIEAEIPFLGVLLTGGLAEQVEILQSAGIKVGMISHGSDTRIPSKHVALEPHSPFQGDLDGFTADLEIASTRNNKLLDDLNLPEFVSTPDLQAYRPSATWLPTLIDTDLWKNPGPLLLGTRKPVVVHVPSRAALKGTQAISRAAEALQDEGVIEYRELSGIPHKDMPKHIADADIVIDQVGMGLYGVASIEAMSAGKVVVAQVWESTRRLLKERTGLELPIVEANPDSIGSVIRDIASRPERYKQLGEDGKSFASTAHSPEAAAAALQDFLT